MFRIGRRETMTVAMPISLLCAVTLMARASFPSPAAPGAEAGPGKTLEECVAVALDRNPQYKASLEGVVSAGEAAKAAQAPYYPDFSFSMGYQRMRTHIFLPNSLDIPLIVPVVGPTDVNSASVSGSYTLWDSGLRKAQKEAGRANQAAALELSGQSREDVTFAVHQAYYGLLAAQEARDVAEQSLKRTEDHQRLAETRKAAGAVPLVDVMRARVEVANAKLALVQAEGNLRVARGGLNTAMGLPPDAPLSLATPGGDPAPPGDQEAEALFTQALRDRPELKAAAERAASKKAQVSAARSTYGPKVLASAKYGRLDSDYFPQDLDWAVGVTFQIPIFSYARSHNLAKARSDLAQEELNTKRIELSVQQEVWSDLSKVQEAWASIASAQALKADAAETLRLAEARYAAGAGTVTDFLDAETNLSQAELALVQAVYGYRVAGSALRKAVGSI